MFRITFRRMLLGFFAFMSLLGGAVYATHLTSYWSSFTSEEYPPLTSSNGYLIDGFFCSGGYCDNTYIRNRLVNRNYGHSYWTSFFSEEATNNRICSGANEFVTGVACKGSYCDNVSLQCTALTNGNHNSGNCQWTPSFSEEEGSQYLPAGYYAVGMQCLGSYCDNKRIWACRLE